MLLFTKKINNSEVLFHFSKSAVFNFFFVCLGHQYFHTLFFSSHSDFLRRLNLGGWRKKLQELIRQMLSQHNYYGCSTGGFGYNLFIDAAFSNQTSLNQTNIRDNFHSLFHLSCSQDNLYFLSLSLNSSCIFLLFRERKNFCDDGKHVLSIST